MIHLQKCRNLSLRYCSVDNNCFLTEAVKQVGGFPKVIGHSAMDAILQKKLTGLGYKWIVDYNTISKHLKTVRQDIIHSYKYSISSFYLKDFSIMRPKPTLFIDAIDLLISRKFNALFAYSILNLSKALGFLAGRVRKRTHRFNHF